MVHTNARGDPQAPKGSTASSSQPAVPWGNSAPQIWQRCPPSMGTTAGSPSLAPLRATKEKGVDSGQAWADPFPEEKRQGAQPRGHVHSHALRVREFAPGGCREALNPQDNILYLQEFGSQASRLSPGSPGRTCLPSSAPSLPCKAKNRI